MHPMLKLFAANRRKGFFAAEKSGDSDTLYLYDMIVDTDDEAEFWGGVSPEAFARTLGGMDAPVIHLRVNSPGGSVFAARTMEQAIREHKSQVIAHIDGWAASAASFLIMGADDRVAAPGSFIMIHKAWTMAFGNSDDLIRTADLLEQIDASLVKTYAIHTGQSAEDISAWMAAETWMEADRAAELGFVDRVAEKKEKAQARAAWDLSAYANAPHVRSPEPDRDAMARAAAVKLISA